MLSENAFKIGRKKGNDFFDHSTTLKDSGTCTCVIGHTYSNCATLLTVIGQTGMY